MYTGRYNINHIFVLVVTFFKAKLKRQQQQLWQKSTPPTTTSAGQWCGSLVELVTSSNGKCVGNSLISTDWVYDWLSDSVTGWLTQWLTLCMTDWLTNSMYGWLTLCMTDRLSDWLAGLLTDWPSQCRPRCRPPPPPWWGPVCGWAGQCRRSAAADWPAQPTLCWSCSCQTQAETWAWSSGTGRGRRSRAAPPAGHEWTGSVQKVKQQQKRF